MENKKKNTVDYPCKYYCFFCLAMEIEITEIPREVDQE